MAEKVLKKGEGYFSDNISMDGTISHGYYTPVYREDDTSAPIGMVFAGIEKQPTYHSILNILNTIIVIVIIAIVFCTIIVQVSATSMTRALNRSIACVKEVSAGNLAVTFDQKTLSRSDEIGDLTKAVQMLQTELLNIIQGIKETTDTLVRFLRYIRADLSSDLHHDPYSTADRFRYHRWRQYTGRWCKERLCKRTAHGKSHH